MASRRVAPHIRTTFLPTTPEVIAARNAAEGRVGTEAYLAPDQEVARMDRNPDPRPGRIRPPDVAVARRWITHPAEEVRVTFLRRSVAGPSFLYLGEEFAAVDAAALRATREAGELWNPYLDVVAERELRNIRGPKTRLAAWVAAQTDPRALDPLTHFTSPFILETLADAPALDDQHLPALFGAPDALVRLATRPGLTPAVAADLWAWAAGPLDLYDRRDWARRHAIPQGKARLVVEALLAQPDLPLPAGAARAALRWVLAGVGHAHFAECVLDRPELGPDDAAAIFAARAVDDRQIARQLLQHPKTPLAVLREALAQGLTPDRLAAVAAHPRATTDAAIVEILRAHGGIDAAAAVAPHATPEWLATRFRRWAASSPARLLDLLEQGTVPAGFALTQEQALLLLSHADGTVRARAVYVVPRYLPTTEAPAPAPEEPSRNPRGR